MGRVREAIIEDRFPAFVRGFFADLYAGGKVPEWAVVALRGVGVELDKGDEVRGAWR